MSFEVILDPHAGCKTFAVFSLKISILMSGFDLRVMTLGVLENILKVCRDLNIGNSAFVVR